MKDLLSELGLKLPDLVAGFAGGVVNAIVFKRSEPWAIVGSVVVGALTANYLTELAQKTVLVVIPGTSAGTAAFITGLTGMALCQGLIEAVKRWRPGLRK